jgi:hypothetical protein
MQTRAFAKIMAERPKTVILLFTLFTLFVGSQATNLFMMSDFTGYLPRDDPTIDLWNEINEEFNLGSSIIILVDQRDRANDIRTYKVLDEMDEVIRCIDDYPGDGGLKDGVLYVRSLSNLIKEENFKWTHRKVVPDNEKAIHQYMGTLTISAMDGILYTTEPEENAYEIAVIIIQLSNDADFDEILERVQTAVENEGNIETTMTITGTVAMQRAIRERSMNYLLLSFPLAIVFVSIVLIYFHRSLKGVIIAFLPPAFALILTFGTLGAVSPELTLISVAIVALLMGLGVDYSIHLMNRFAEEKHIENRVERIEKILNSTGKAILLSTITTFIGFASLMISSMAPMAAFGFGCSIGILYCFLSATILVPTLSNLFNFERAGKIPSWRKFAKFALNQRKRILLIAIFFSVMSIIVIPEVDTDVNYFDISPKDVPEVEAMYEYSESFGGGSNFNALVIETNRDGLLDSDVINAIYDMELEMRDAIKSVFPEIPDENLENTVYSIVDEIKTVYDTINRSVVLEFFNKILDGEEIVKDLAIEEGLVDEDFSKTLVFVAIPIGKSIEKIQEAINEINEIADRTQIPNNGKVSILTGQDAVNVAVNKKLTEEQIRSMILALLLVLAALIVIFNSAIYGVLTMIPVIFVLIWEPGFLVLTDIPLSLITISIGSIMVGVGIDYGVHITHRYREELAKGLSRKQATKVSIEKTGLSLIEAALTTIAGMASIYFVNIVAITEFITVVILMVALSAIAAALLLPVFYQFKSLK